MAVALPGGGAPPAVGRTEKERHVQGIGDSPNGVADVGREAADDESRGAACDAQKAEQPARMATAHGRHIEGRPPSASDQPRARKGRYSSKDSAGYDSEVTGVPSSRLSGTVRRQVVLRERLRHGVDVRGFDPCMAKVAAYWSKATSSVEYDGSARICRNDQMMKAAATATAITHGPTARATRLRAPSTRRRPGPALVGRTCRRPLSHRPGRRPGWRVRRRGRAGPARPPPRRPKAPR